MLKASSAVFLLMLLGTREPAAAQWVLRGHVLADSLLADRRLLTVRVYDEARALRATTHPDSVGNFEISIALTSAMSMQLRIDLPSQPLHAIVVDGRDSDTTRIEISLEKGVILLPAVTGRAQRSVIADRMRGFDERRRLGVGHFVTRRQIDDRPGSTRVSDFLRGIPGVAFRSMAGSSGGRVAWTLANMSALTTRNACPMYMFLDGVPIHGAQGWDIDIIPTSQLEGIEVYRGVAEVPAVYAVQQAKCGVIALWTRRGRS